MTRKELIEIGKQILKAEGTESELDKLYEVFNQNVPYPNEQIYSITQKITMQEKII